MIRTVLCDLGRPAITGDDIPTTGHLTWAPTRIRVVDKHVTLPSSFDAALNGGVVEVKLMAPDGTWAWSVRENVPDGRRSPRLVHIPEGPEDEVLLYGDLVEIDPKTLDPAASPEAAWWVQQMAQAKRLDDLADEVETLAGVLATATGQGVDPEALKAMVTEAVTEAMADLPPARLDDTVNEAIVTAVQDVLPSLVSSGGGIHVGRGQPPEVIPGARIGDVYIDRDAPALHILGGPSALKSQQK